MAYEWLEESLLAHKGVTRDVKLEWNAVRYLVGGKMFAMSGENKQGEAIFSFKLDPAFSELLRQQYPQDITPGYYLNKVHWSSLRMEGSVPDEVVQQMADQAYTVLLKGFSKKMQTEILAE